MFSVRQKRDIANKVQQILKETNHPELPDSEIQFLLHVDGFFSMSWADIRNNGAVTNPDVNPHNEAQDKNTPAEDQHSKDVKPEPKPLAQYLDEYIEHESELDHIEKTVAYMYAYDSWRELLEQALDAYESTENVMIEIERV